MTLTRHSIRIFKLSEEHFQIAALATFGLFETLPNPFQNVSPSGNIE